MYVCLLVWCWLFRTRTLFGWSRSDLVCWLLFGCICVRVYESGVERGCLPPFTCACCARMFVCLFVLMVLCCLFFVCLLLTILLLIRFVPGLWIQINHLIVFTFVAGSYMTSLMSDDVVVRWRYHRPSNVHSLRKFVYGVLLTRIEKVSINCFQLLSLLVLLLLFFKEGLFSTTKTCPVPLVCCLSSIISCRAWERIM